MKIYLFLNKDQDLKLKVDTMNNNVKIFGAMLVQHTVNQKSRKVIHSCLLLRAGRGEACVEFSPACISCRLSIPSSFYASYCSLVKPSLDILPCS